MVHAGDQRAGCVCAPHGGIVEPLGEVFDVAAQFLLLLLQGVERGPLRLLERDDVLLRAVHQPAELADVLVAAADVDDVAAEFGHGVADAFQPTVKVAAELHALALGRLGVAPGRGLELGLELVQRWGELAVFDESLAVAEGREVGEPRLRGEVRADDLGGFVRRGCASRLGALRVVRGTRGAGGARARGLERRERRGRGHRRVHVVVLVLRVLEVLVVLFEGVVLDGIASVVAVVLGVEVGSREYPAELVVVEVREWAALVFLERGVRVLVHRRGHRGVPIERAEIRVLAVVARAVRG